MNAPLSFGAMKATAGKLSTSPEEAPEGNSLWWTIASAMALLAFRPYQGIVHDARLYVGYALSKLHSETIGRDIVFTMDGQSGLSIYPIALRTVVDALGPARGAQVATMCGLLIWWTCYRVFVRAALPTLARGWRTDAILIAIAAMPAFYGAQSIISVAEPFAAPRAIAEGLCVAAFAFAMRRSRWPMFALLFVAMSVHPLMTAPAAVVCAALFVVSDEEAKWRAALVRLTRYSPLVLSVAILMLFVVVWRLPRFDSEWRQALDAKHVLVFPRYWPASDYARLLLHLVTIGMAMRIESSPLRAMAIVSSIVALVGVLLTWILGDIGNVILIAQGQAWRSLWIVWVAATLSLIQLLLYACSRRGRLASAEVCSVEQAAIALLAASWAFQELSVNASILLLLSAFLWFAPSRITRLPRYGTTLIVVLAAMVYTSTIAISAYVGFHVVWTSPDVSMRWASAYLNNTGIPTGIAVSFVVGALVGRLSPGRLVMLLPASMLGVLAALSFDSRGRYQRYLESELDARHSSTASPVASAGTVAFYLGDLDSWAFAGVPSWGSVSQGIPVVFSRSLAITWNARSVRLTEAGLQVRSESAGVPSVPMAEALDGPHLGRLCEGADHPTTVVVPVGSVTGSFSPLVRSAGFRLAEAKPIRPRRFGAAWRTVNAYDVLVCPTTDTP